MAKPAERLGELATLLVDAKIAGHKLGENLVGHAYVFRSNEQAAAVATEVVRRWLEDRRPRLLKVDWDDSALVEALATILRDCESEWRNESETREEYGQGQRFAYAAERVIEELQRMENK